MLVRKAQPYPTHGSQAAPAPPCLLHSCWDWTPTHPRCRQPGLLWTSTPGHTEPEDQRDTVLARQVGCSIPQTVLGENHALLSPSPPALSVEAGHPSSTHLEKDASSLPRKWLPSSQEHALNCTLRTPSPCQRHPCSWAASLPAVTLSTWQAGPFANVCVSTNSLSAFWCVASAGISSAFSPH